MRQGAPCLVVGGVNVDLLGRVERFAGPDEAAALSDFTVAPGGHAGNCAVALARLGVTVRLAASVGTDPLARVALDALRAAAVEIDFMEPSDRLPTGTALMPVGPRGERILYVARGANDALGDAAICRAADDCESVVVFDPPLETL